MKPARLPLLLLPLLFSSRPPACGAAGESVFARDRVIAFGIRLPQAAFWDTLSAWHDRDLERYLPATVVIDGVAYDSVGVRFKGNSSYTHPHEKRPFRISFDAFRAGQRWDSMKTVHLNNGWEDPTFLREKLHLDFCRDAGVMAPRANFAELYLNGERWGLYTLVEHVDKTFLSTRDRDNRGNLYKAVDGLVGGPVSDFRWYGSSPEAYHDHYELRTEDSVRPWTDLVAVLDSLNRSSDPAAALAAVVDLGDVYRAFATDLLLGNLDSYLGSCRNFYLYFNPASAKMEWIAWDGGMSFGSFWGLASDFEGLSLTYASNPGNRPLAARIFEIGTLRAEYLGTACRLSTALLPPERVHPRIDALAALIRPYVEADPRKMYTTELFETNLSEDIDAGGHRKPGLKSFVNRRAEAVRAQLEGLGVTCAAELQPGEVAINEFAADNRRILDPAGEAEDWIELYNAGDRTIDLGGSCLSDDPLRPERWRFPDGTTLAPGEYLIVWADEGAGQAGWHASFRLSAAGEYIGLAGRTPVVLDSVTFGRQRADLTMARVPDGTGAFTPGSPTFGRDNDTRVTIASGELVINEFMASGDSIPDPAGETDDWIELRNNSGRELELSTVFLSDDGNSPEKWRFPEGIVLAPEGYLVVWADEDSAQAGLHAGFALAAEGEEIVLSGGDLRAVDRVEFGAQRRNLSMARFPDGTGPFFQTRRPTPGGPNDGSGAGGGILEFRVPTPLRAGMEVSFRLGIAGPVALELFDLQGRRVATLLDRELPEGPYRAAVDPLDLRSGLYFCLLRTSGGAAVRRLLLVK